MKIREQRQSHFGPIRRIYALLDDRFDELQTKLRINHLTAVKSVGILERISIGGRADLNVILNGNLNAQKYTDPEWQFECSKAYRQDRERERLHVTPYVAAVDNFFLLMQDNARSHTAHLVEDLVESGTIKAYRKGSMLAQSSMLRTHSDQSLLFLSKTWR
ncbi:hypothetical protein TNCV_3048791 [Trichonephila clavipes]|nr:hypothetical protein TNCV_3048791 [Trichonephila clavipes]